MTGSQRAYSSISSAKRPRTISRPAVATARWSGSIELLERLAAVDLSDDGI
ncbi:hypothetical protein ABT173_35245 [Streptomyces sp. NPDC001795]|uniref:hypothetical protein n=1 Tax=Streptomyces sp. NPDC001795 TaxID=3154525 RepID=UPI00331E1B31